VLWYLHITESKQNQTSCCTCTCTLYMCLTPTNSNVIRSPPPPTPPPFFFGGRGKKNQSISREPSAYPHISLLSRPVVGWLDGWFIRGCLHQLSRSLVSRTQIFFNFFFRAHATCYNRKRQFCRLTAPHTQTYTYTHNITPGRGYLTFFLYEPACDDCDDDDDDDDDGANLCM